MQIEIKTLIIIFTLFLAGCSTPKPVAPPPLPEVLYELSNGVSKLTDNLVLQVKTRTEINEQIKTISLIPFIEISSREIIKTSLTIERIIKQKMVSNYPLYDAQRITRDTFHQSNYIFNGSLVFEAHPSGQFSRKLYHLYASIVDKNKRIVVASANIWLSNKNLDYTKVFGYEDYPVHSMKETTNELIKVSKLPAGSYVSEKYISQVNLNALLGEARTAHEDGKYFIAVQLFNDAMQLSGGGSAEVYSGLYAANFRQNKLEEAKRNVIDIIKGTTHYANLKPVILPFNFAFKSGSSLSFVPSDELKKHYSLWLEGIASYMKQETRQCVNIIGHASKMGAESARGKKRMLSLSKKRAKNIQKRIMDLRPNIARQIIQRSKVIGMGVQCLIDGSKPDNAQNAIDRRVELEFFNCNSPPLEREGKQPSCPNYEDDINS